MSVRGDRLAEHDPRITDVAAAVRAAVAVEQLVEGAGRRHTNPIAVARYRREVQNGDDVFAGGRSSLKRDDAVLVVVTVDPVEAGRIEVQLVQRRLAAVNAIQVGDELF